MSTESEIAQARESSIELPDTTGETSAEFQKRTGAVVPKEGESFYDAQSRGRESAIAARPSFSETFNTDQFGNRTATVDRPPQMVQDILFLDRPMNQKEATRLRRFKGTTAGKNFDFGKFNETLAKTRRGFLGEKERDRQMDAAFRNEARLDSGHDEDSPGLDIPTSDDRVDDPSTDFIVDSGEATDILGGDPNDPSVATSILS